MRYTSRALLAGLGLLAVACPGTVSAPRRPNVLLVSLDTTRFDVFGAYGHPGGATPNVDRLAASGARFTRAYTVTPLTIPAHSSLMTGLYPPRHGVRDNGDFFLDEGAVTLAELLEGAGYQTMASVGAEVTSHHWGFAQGFDAYFDDLDATAARGNRWAVERPGDQVVDDALAWLESPDRGTDPWFAWVHLFDPHHPYEPRPEYAARFPDQAYLAEVAFADAQVGRILDSLSARGVLDDTLVVVVADHGEGFGEHGEAQHGLLLYNSTTQIPMIVRPPGGLPKGRSEGRPTSLVDVVPTVLAVADLPIPEDLDGIDLSPVFGETQESPPVFRTVYAESLYAWHVYGWAPQHALVDNEYKLIDSTTPELYYAADLREQGDLAGQKGERVVAMRESLARKLEGWHVDENIAGRAEVSAERVSQLAALGYLSGSGASGDTPAEGLPDPVRRMGVLAQVEAARTAVKEERFDEALALVRAVLVDDPGLMPARQLQVDVLLAMGRTDEALVAAQESLAIRDSSQTRAALGRVLIRLGRAEEGLVELERSLETDPYAAATWAPYLSLLYQGRDFERTKGALERARTVLPDAPFVLAMEGAVRVDAGDHEGAKVLLERAVEGDPKAPFAHHFLGVIAGAAGDAERAEREYKAEIEGHPEAIPPRLKLVELLGVQHRYEEQIAVIDVLRTLERPNPGNHFARGTALYSLGRLDEAAAEAVTCRERWSKYPPCALLHANVLAKQGDRAGGEAVYQEALKLQEAALAGEGAPPAP